MSSSEFSIESDQPRERRVVEAEIHMPKLDEIKLPKVDLKPLRHVAEQVLVTGLGAGVLLARGISHLVSEANRAGAEAARDPGPVVGTVLAWIRGSAAESSGDADLSLRVPVLPIDDYDALTPPEIADALRSLSRQELETLEQYEQTHQGRATVLTAIANRLATID